LPDERLKKLYFELLRGSIQFAKATAPELVVPANVENAFAVAR